MRGIVSASAAAVLLVALCGVGTGGCERTVSERETTVRHRDGSVTKERRTVKEGPDGSRTVEREVDVDRD